MLSPSPSRRDAWAMNAGPRGCATRGANAMGAARRTVRTGAHRSVLDRSVCIFSVVLCFAAALLVLHSTRNATRTMGRMPSSRPLGSRRPRSPRRCRQPEPGLRRPRRRQRGLVRPPLRRLRARPASFAAGPRPRPRRRRRVLRRPVSSSGRSLRRRVSSRRRWARRRPAQLSGHSAVGGGPRRLQQQRHVGHGERGRLLAGAALHTRTHACRQQQSTGHTSIEDQSACLPPCSSCLWAAARH